MQKCFSQSKSFTLNKFWYIVMWSKSKFQCWISVKHRYFLVSKTLYSTWDIPTLAFWVIIYLLIYIIYITKKTWGNFFSAFLYFEFKLSLEDYVLCFIVKYTIVNGILRILALENIKKYVLIWLSQALAI